MLAAMPRGGVAQSPANLLLEGVVDLSCHFSGRDRAQFFNQGNPPGINYLQAFPGRGIRAWGARTLSRDRLWQYVGVRRLFLTLGRWIERNLADVVFEPNDFRLWIRINRELTVYLDSLFQQGVLKGQVPEEAFYVKCDAETNPATVRDVGQMVAEIGLAPAVPGEFIVARLIQGETGVSLTT